MSTRCGNRRSAKRLAAGSLLGVAIVVAAGCRGGRLPVAPVQGKVLYRGNPLQFGGVMFQPNVGPPAKGKISSDGTFRLTTYREGDGAVVGTHRVRITCFEIQRPGHQHAQSEQEAGAGRSLIPRKYCSFATSGLQVEVGSTNEPFVFELTD